MTTDTNLDSNHLQPPTNRHLEKLSFKNSIRLNLNSHQNQRTKTKTKKQKQTVITAPREGVIVV